MRPHPHASFVRYSPARRLLTALAWAAAAAAGGAQAQTTIDQNKALAGSLTPGDLPGFPVTLSLRGSYKLTSNLVVPAGLSGVVVTADGVTLDLNGFSITGPGVCTRVAATAVVTCVGVVAAVTGVELQSEGNTVRNGTVRGFQSGILMTGADQLEALLVEHNAGTGVGASSSNQRARTLVTHVRSQLNGGHGFATGDALMQGCTAAANGSHGFVTLNTVVLDSVAYNNGNYGFWNFTGGTGALIMGRSVATQNKQGSVVGGAVSLGGNYDGINVF